jgi:hypothetical protein
VDAQGPHRQAALGPADRRRDPDRHELIACLKRMLVGTKTRALEEETAIVTTSLLRFVLEYAKNQGSHSQIGVLALRYLVIDADLYLCARPKGIEVGRQRTSLVRVELSRPPVRGYRLSRGGASFRELKLK